MASPSGRIVTQIPGVLERGHPFAAENCMLSAKQLLACYWVLVDREHLPTLCHVIIYPESPTIMTQFCETHQLIMLGGSSKNPAYWKWYIQFQAQAVPEVTSISRQPEPRTICHYCTSTTPSACTSGYMRAKQPADKEETSPFLQMVVCGHKPKM